MLFYVQLGRRKARILVAGLLFLSVCAAPAEEPTSIAIQNLLDSARYQDAEKAGRQWIDRLDREGKADTQEYADAIDSLATALGSSFAPLAEIQPLVDRSIAIKTKLRGERDVSIASSLNIIGIRKFRAGDYAGSIADFARARKLEDLPASGAIPVLLAATLNGLGLAVGAKGDPAQALNLHQQALTIREKEFGTEHWRTAEVLFSLSTDYRQRGDLMRSLEFSQRSVALFEKTNPNHPSAAMAINALASVYRERGEYERAKPLFEKSIRIYERSLGPDTPPLAASFNNYGLCLKSMSDFAGARDALEQAVRISTKANGPKSSITAQTLGNLGILYQQTGDYSKARQTYETALSVLETTLGPAHEGTASVLTSLGLVLRDMGDIRAASPYIERALAIYQKSFGPENPKTLQVLTDLGSIRRQQKDFGAARELVERSLAGSIRTLGPRNATTAGRMGSLAATLAELGEMEKAKELYRQAIEISDEQRGRESDLSATVRSELSDLELRTGNDREALALSRESFAVYAKLFGPDYNLNASVLSVKAEAERRLGERAVAFDDALESARVRRWNLSAVARTTSERQALLYAEKGGNGLDVALKLAAGGLCEEQKARLWDAVIRDRALVLDEMAERQRSTRDPEAPELAALNRTLTLAREELANSVVAGPRAKETDYTGRVMLLRASVENSERQMALRSEPFRSRLDRERASFDEVWQALPQGSALAAYVRYSEGYVAFVIPAGEQTPVLVSLGTADRIDGLVRRWRAQIDRERDFQGREAARNEALYREAGSALRRAIWDPIAAQLAGVRDLYLTTDGLLQLVNISALPVGRTSYLMETGPLLHLLSAERDIRETSQATGTGGMLAMGRPAFDSRIARPAAGATQLRGARNNCEAFSSLDFADLPGSADEAQAVLAIWRARGNAGVALTGDKATKLALEQMAAGTRIIHLATHGFLLGHECAPQSTEDPLLRSGLALAGANHSAEGILTAEEVASLDLSSTELVVLSGCDTGSGELHAGEGVMGLRRAFRMAGAQNLIMSLWPVTDDGARAWMTALYQARFSRRAGTAASVREASLGQLRARRTKGQSTHPFYWAGFIAVGGL